MIEELIRIESGIILHEGTEFQIDLEVSRGSCTGFFADNHMLAGSAYHGIFSGSSSLLDGRAFVMGERIRIGEAGAWIRNHCMIIDRNRFVGRELTAGDFVVALGKNMKSVRKEDPDRWITGEQSLEIMERMGIRFPWEVKLHTLSMLDYYRLAIYKAWFIKSRIVVLDRITEILRQQDLREFMSCVQIVLEQGAAVILMDMNEQFLFDYADRVDIMKNRKLVYRLYPEDYGRKLYEILGWEKETFYAEGQTREKTGRVVFSVENLRFDGLQPMNFEIRSGEIGLLTDENYRTGSRIRDCFLGDEDWLSGSVYLNGRQRDRTDLLRMVGSEIGIQTVMPDRSGGVLFTNLTALENLSTTLVPKAGKHVFRRKIVENIETTASRWFLEEDLRKPVSEWTLPQRLRLSYLKWYLMNPKLLICLFPFAGQESLHHETIIQMLVLCARRGMAVWIVSSGIDSICEHTENEEFIARLRRLD